MPAAAGMPLSGPGSLRVSPRGADGALLAVPEPVGITDGQFHLVYPLTTIWGYTPKVGMATRPFFNLPRATGTY